ncbi:MAG: hypothetical protein QM696_03690 [Steroidobacteraceae bacterium]
MLSRSGGAATAEFHVVALLAVIPLCAAILQTGLLLIANHQVDLAAFMAARAGAVAGGDAQRMRQVFQAALSPLLVRTSGGIDAGNVAGRVLAAQAAAAPAFALYSRIQVLGPGAEESADFAVQRQGRRVIPNDSLEWRSRRVGERSGISLQEANVLRIAATWCHPLIVPLAAEMMIAALRRLDADPWHQLCYADRRVPVRSVALAPMQSDFVVRLASRGQPP